MAETPEVGSGGLDGAVETPNQPVSQTPSKPIEVDVAQLVSQLRTELSEQYSGVLKEVRGLQSKQDKSESNFQQQLARLEQLQSSGLSKEQALSTMQKEDNDLNWRTNMESMLKDALSGKFSNGNTNQSQQMLTEVMSEYKLDPKDPYVASMLQGKQFANRTEAEAFAGKVLRDKLLSNQPNQAQNATTIGNNVPVVRTAEVVTRELQELQYRPTAENDARRQELIKELQALQG